jgi:hypothetical protein
MSQFDRPPALTSLVVHRDLTYRYSFLYPDGWYQTELLSEGGHGRIFSPLPGDTLTSLSVEARDLGTPVTTDDLPALRQGLLAGLHALPGAVVASHEDYAIGETIGLEAHHTYRAGGAVRRRWTRLLYQQRLQLRLIAQGETAAEFDYWLPHFTLLMRSVRFGDWWADVTGQSWLPALPE